MKRLRQFLTNTVGRSTQTDRPTVKQQPGVSIAPDTGTVAVSRLLEYSHTPKKAETNRRPGKSVREDPYRPLMEARGRAGTTATRPPTLTHHCAHGSTIVAKSKRGLVPPQRVYRLCVENTTEDSFPFGIAAQCRNELDRRALVGGRVSESATLGVIGPSFLQSVPRDLVQATWPSAPQTGN